MPQIFNSICTHHQVVGDVLYTGSTDHVLRSWQAYTGDDTGSYTGSSSTITCFRPLVRHEMCKYRVNG